MDRIIALVGMTGSGKSIVSDYLAKNNFNYLRFGQITMDIIKEKNLEPTEENERKIRENIRKEYGMGGYAVLNLPKIEKLIKEGNVVIDGLYSWAEYKILKEKFQDNLIVVAIYASPKIRYNRLINRKINKEDTKLKNRPMTYEQAKSRDYAEIENSDKGGPIAMADFTIINESTVEELYNKVEDVLDGIRKD
jgi:dephospho-CoA kinase